MIHTGTPGPERGVFDLSSHYSLLISLTGVLNMLMPLKQTTDYKLLQRLLLVQHKCSEV